GKTYELLRSIYAVDNTLVFYPGTCGKGDPDQGVPVWLGGPNMRLRNVRIKVMVNE
ncbi:TldD/PmbA family protein, partial [Sulfolobus sp. E5]